MSENTVPRGSKLAPKTNLPPVDANTEIDDSIKRFRDTPFSSNDFIDIFKEHHPNKWNEIVAQYGVGGKGSGNRYSSSGFIGRQLDYRASQNRLAKLPRRPAPSGWGNAWIVVWQSIAGANNPTLYPDEIDTNKQYIESALKRVTVNRYERDEKARIDCINHHKPICSACEMDFGKTYGEHGAGYIHVHHLRPLHTIAEEYKVDPIEDLLPVCPNCHAMIHYRGGLLTIEEVRAMLRSQSGESLN